MPSEITLGESMPVRCRGHVLLVVRPTATAAADCSGTARPENKIGVAVRLEGYEYLPESESSATFPRVSALRPEHDEEQPLAHSSRPVLG
jgi:hypothetical protein